MNSPDRTSIPGFVDLQVNGTHGIDFSGGTLSQTDCERAFGLIREGGTAAFLPTIITSPIDRLRRNLEVLARSVRTNGPGERTPGIHLEGPFLEPTPGAIGAHNPDWVVSPDITVFDRLQESADGAIRIMTVSAGVPGVKALIAHAVSRNVIVALGHHTAGFAAVRRAADAGARLLTHLGNGIPHEINRHDNPIFAGLADSRLTATLIADGHHLPDELLDLFIGIKGLEQSILVSDAAPVAGLPPGRYENFGTEVDVKDDGLVVNTVTGYLAGSGRTLLECVNRLAARGECETSDLIRLALDNPAAVIGIDTSNLDGPGLVYDSTARGFVRQ